MNLEMISIDLPTFKVGETGPLFGRVVVSVDNPSAEKMNARAWLEFEGGAQVKADSPQKAIYSGLKSVLNFPIRLEEASTENLYYIADLNIEIDSEIVYRGKVNVYVRTDGFFFRTYRSNIDDCVYPYALYIPEEVMEGTVDKVPLLLSLHGAWSNHALNMRRLMSEPNRDGEPDEMALTALPIWPELPNPEAIVVCPWGRGTMSYHGPGAQDVKDVLEIVFRELPVDRERVSVTGLSMGGNGTLEIALRNSGLFSAMVPVCSFFSFLYKLDLPTTFKDSDWLKQSFRHRNILNYAVNARGFKGVHIHHGVDDPVVPVEQSIKTSAKLDSLGIKHFFSQYDNVGHNAWEPAYRDMKTFGWMIDKKRRQPSDTLEFVAVRYEEAVQQWLEIEKFAEYGQPAHVTAVWDKKNKALSLNTENVEILAADLNLLPGVKKGDKLTVSANGAAGTFTAPSEGKLRLKVSGGAPEAAAISRDNGLHKKKNLEGPLFDAIDDRVILVYGTSGSKAETEKSLKQLKAFADWGELPDVHFMIRPDKELTPEDIENCNLVLFGDETTNSVIAKVNKRGLPISFKGGEIVTPDGSFPKAGNALKMVYPNPLNPTRLVMINYNEDWDYSEIWFYMGAFEILPDYFIYQPGGKKTPYEDKVLSAGYFDENWKWRK